MTDPCSAVAYTIPPVTPVTHLVPASAFPAPGGAEGIHLLLDACSQNSPRQLYAQMKGGDAMEHAQKCSNA